jgi:Single-strand binding protein family
MPDGAPNLNSVTLVGQLTRDPALRSLPDRRSVCDLRLAVNDQREPPLFIAVAIRMQKPQRLSQ